jgi:hypothetical protein
MNDDLTSLFQADVEEKQKSAFDGLNDGGLNSVASLALKIKKAEETVSELEAKLKSEKKALMRLTDEELPEMLGELGLSSIKLSDGSKVDIKKTYGGSILKSNEEEAFSWLRNNGYGDIVKNIVSINFGMGEDQKAQEFKSLAESTGLSPDQKETVHAMTLRAFIKERVESGDDFPMELFGAYVGQRAIITGGSK